MEELADLRLFRHELLQPMNTSGTFNLKNASEKVDLARQLWSGGYVESMQALAGANPALLEVLRAKVANQHDTHASDSESDHRSLCGARRLQSPHSITECGEEARTLFHRSLSET